MRDFIIRTARTLHVRSSRALGIAIAAILLVAFAIGMMLIDGSRSETSKPVRVAVIDGGIDASHPALKDTKIEVYSTPGVGLGDSEHGTAMASIIVEQARAGTVLGPPEIELLDVRALTSQGKGDIADVAAGIEIAANHRADLIVASLSAEIGSLNLQAATEEAQRKGAVIVAASGNGLGDFSSFPAQYPGVIAVGALDNTHNRLRFTNAHDVDLLAPGEEVNAAGPAGGRKPYTGTSPATAVVAGKLAACWPLLDLHSLDQSNGNVPVNQAIASAIERAGKDPSRCNSI